MTNLAAEKLFNIGNIKSSKNIFRVCPKFLDYMTLNGETNAAIRNHPCSLSLPTIRLPDKVDKAAAKYLRDEVLMSPQDLVVHANSLRDALWSRMIIAEKNMLEYVRRNIKKKTITEPNLYLPEDILKQIEDSPDPNLEEIVMANAGNIMRMHKIDVDDMVKREMQNTELPIRYSTGLSNLYLVARLAPNYAAACKVFYEIRKRCSQFMPENLFDFGSGLGSATWAANSVWANGTIKEHFLVDASTNLLSISEYLLKDGAIKQHQTALPGVTFRSYLPASADRQYDIVISCYSLLDITGGYLNRREILANLWKKTNKFLVLIDSGSKAGFQAILEARNWLLESTKKDSQPAQLFAPCPHSLGCPKAESACNFKVKYEKLRLTESAESYSNEVFSYVVFHKGDVSEHQRGEESALAAYPRVVSYKVSGQVQDLCSRDGEVARYFLAPKDRPLRRYLKKCVPGDLMPIIKIDNED